MNNLVNIARSLPNKGRTHIFLGSPFSDGCDKTTVEPGNNFSPGVWTCGISIWIETDGKYYTPDLLDDDEILWGFNSDSGLPPFIHAEWMAGENITLKSTLTHIGVEGAEGADFCEVTISGVIQKKSSFYIVIRDIGPAGGKIEKIEWNNTKSETLINGTIRVSFEDPPAECKIENADIIFDSPIAIINYPINFNSDEKMSIRFKVEHGFQNRPCGGMIPLERPFSTFNVEEGMKRSVQQWREALSARVFSPDSRLEKVWEREIFHILSAMECGLPRIGAVNYPVFWLRDGVVILRALDLIGRHDLAHIGNDYLAQLYFGGGFGAEADAPGEALWTLISHAKITKDTDWLEKIFPQIVTRVELIERMLSTREPLRVICESRMPSYQNTPGINILCLSAQNGCIHGRMDWHSPDFFINCWTIGGLRLASDAAKLVGKEELYLIWKGAAEKLETAVTQYLLPEYGNDRDPIITPYPTNALSGNMSEVKGKFEEWYTKNRLTTGNERVPEPLWTYFEAAQAHNAILLGLRDIAWVNLDGMLSSEGWNDTSAYVEGEPGGNEFLNFRNGEERRGWLDTKKASGGNMPHNWTSAEVVNMIRDIFVVEEKDSLVLGRGVPKVWLKPGSKFGVENMPTDLGCVSYTVTVGSEGELDIDYKGPPKYTLDFQS